MSKRALSICSLIIVVLAIGTVILDQLLPGQFAWQGMLRDSKNFAFWLNSFGPWAILISIVVMIIQTIATPVPLFLVAGANGFIFGASWGIIITMVGAMLGSTLAFYFARFIARDYFNRHLARYMPQVEEMSRRGSCKMIFFARLVPILPSSVISYAAGLSKVSFTGFFVASVFGKLPEIIIYTILGHSLDKAEGMLTKVTVVLIVISLICFSLQSKRVSGFFRKNRDDKNYSGK